MPYSNLFYPSIHLFCLLIYLSACLPACLFTFTYLFSIFVCSYIFSGDEDTIEFEPRFTYYGFRYVQITGFPGAPDHQSLVAHFVHTAVDEESSIVFSEDHNILNGAQHITRFASLSNFISIPTDCPQRERRGWLGDAQLSAEFTIHNFDMAASYTKFLRDINDTQLFVATENKGDGAVPDCVPWYHHGGLPSDPAWGVAYTLLTYWMYHYYGTK
jgi:alpha-L-rhamnosidase